jgi:acyl-CoA synthetase (AMP-forming)/AMP-acid ligase II/thioesterase domain-containing protein/acyl carrier protein
MSVAIADDRASSCVAALLLRAASQHPKSGVYVATGSSNAEFLTYPALLSEAQQISAGLQARIASRDTKVALLLDRARDFIPAFWACILGGYVPCPLAPIRNDPERSARHFAHVDALLDRPLFISTEHLLRELPQSVAAMHLDALRTRIAQQTVHQADLSDTAVLMLTSGSTGNSKAVELTHGNVLASMSGRAERLQLTCADITLNWIAFDHVAALMESHMIAVYVGANQVHADPIAMVADPLQFLRLIDRHRVSLAFAPNFFLAQTNGALQTSDMSDRIDLSCLRRIVTGGEANVVETGKRFLDLLAPYGLARNVLWPAFGMTETCAASVYSHEFPDRDLNREFAAVGLPINGLEVRIVDEHGALQVGEPGELQLRGPVIFRRYYNNEEATRAAFTSDGWFRTGDVGRMDDGRLILVARIKDSIIVNGINYFSHEIETQLEQLNGIERSFVAAFATRPKGADTEQLIVAFSPTFQLGDEEQLYRLVVAVRNAVVMLWGFSPALILPLPKDAFPRTSLGKIQRSLMRKRFEAGHFADSVDYVTSVISRQLGPRIPPADSLELEIAQTCCEILELDLTSLSVITSFYDLGATSVKMLRLTHALEQRFGLEGALPIVLRNPSVRELAQSISAKKRGEVGEYDPVVPLQVTGKRTPPLFCVHPGEGDILVWVNLARCFLNDRPIYALLAPGFGAGEERFKSFGEIVSTHVSAILRCQPRGPYLLAGYATGVNIVFEIAKELEARGHRVAFFGCVDWMPTEQASPGAPYGFLATGLAFALGFISLTQWEQLWGELQAPPEREKEDICEYALKFARLERLAELGLDLQKFSVWVGITHWMEQLIMPHTLSGSIKTITVFRSAGLPESPLFPGVNGDNWRNMLRNWDKFASQAKYIDVAGNHFTVLHPEHIVAFSNVLRTEIERALDADSVPASSCDEQVQLAQGLRCDSSSAALPST